MSYKKKQFCAQLWLRLIKNSSNIAGVEELPAPEFKEYAESADIFSTVSSFFLSLSKRVGFILKGYWYG